MTSSGIEPATFRLVVHCATACPLAKTSMIRNVTLWHWDPNGMIKNGDGKICNKRAESDQVASDGNVTYLYSVSAKFQSSQRHRRFGGQLCFRNVVICKTYAVNEVPKKSDCDSEHIFLVFSVTPGKYWDSNLTCPRTIPSHIHPSLKFTIHPKNSTLHILSY